MSKTLASLALAAAGLALAACGQSTEAPEPAGETTAAEMPDAATAPGVGAATELPPVEFQAAPALDPNTAPAT